MFMPKTTKTPKPHQRRSSLQGVHKTPARKKDAVNHLTASAAASRLLPDKEFANLERCMMEQRKAERTRILSAHEAALLEVFKLGPEVFESKDKFLRWLNYPHIPLGGKTPLKLMLLRKAKLVRDELLRIEYGVCA